MKLRDMIFTDGKILSYQTGEQDLNLIFRDNSERDFEIKFIKVVTVKDYDSIGYSIFKSILTKSENNQSLEFLDDNLNPMFKVTFNDAEIARI